MNEFQLMLKKEFEIKNIEKQIDAIKKSINISEEDKNYKIIRLESEIININNN